MVITKKKIIVLSLMIVLIAIFFTFDLHKYLTIDKLKLHRDTLVNLYKTSPFTTLTSFFLGYIVVTALSLPGAAIMTIASGSIFGFITGTIIVSFASSIGATLAFMFARFFLKSYIQNKFGKQLKLINEGVKKEGGFYLFSIRLIPLFPFFLVNILVGLTPMPVRTFYIVSQLGMFLGTMAYVNAGTQLSKIKTLSDIVSPQIVVSFAILGILPLIFKILLPILRKKYVKKT